MPWKTELLFKVDQSPAKRSASLGASSRKWVGRFLIFCLWYGLAFHLKGQTPDPFPIFDQLQSQWNKVQSLEYRMVSSTIVTQEWRDAVKYTGQDRNVIVTKLSIQMKGPNYRWETSSTLSSGIKERESVGGVYNHVLYMLMNGLNPMLVVGAKPESIADNPLSENNPLTDAFAFLDPKTWSSKARGVASLEEIHSRENWASVKSRVIESSQIRLETRPCTKMAIKLIGASKTVVYFSQADKYAPVYWADYDETGFLRREVEVIELQSAPISDRLSLLVPKKLNETTYFGYGKDSYKANIITQQCVDVSLNCRINDNAFIVDPSLAEVTYDRDKNKWTATQR